MGKSTPTPTAQLSTHSGGLQGALEGIVRDVVEILGFTGAMVATFDNGEVLPVKAIYFDPKFLTPELVEGWEKQAGEITGRRISLRDPEIARVYIHRKEDQKNLGVQAAHARKFIISNELFDLFTPITPDSTRELMRGVQEALGIQQVITVPFFIDPTTRDGTSETTSVTSTEDSIKGEFVGNLFAAKRGPITPEDIRVLSTFAQYVASFILSERRRLQVEIIEKLILDIQKNLTSETAVLQRIAEGMVEDLGYVAALVATYDKATDILPVKARYFDPKTVTADQVKTWEQQASAMIGRPLSLTDENIARVYLRQENYRNNLSAKAAVKGQPVSSTELFDLFTPVIPDSARDFVRGIQDALGIHQVIAVPFFLETRGGNHQPNELEGNLFAVSRSHEIQPWEIDILNAFGHQAAAGLRNVDLYRKAEDRKKSAEIFGKMAFTATASVHALRNHLGVIKGTLQILKSVDAENESLISPALKRVDEIATLIENLQEPGKLQNDTDVDVNTCIRRAAEKAIGVDIPWVKLDLTSSLPVRTLPEMLTEAFKVLIKNANEAMSNESVSEAERLLEISSRRRDGMAEVTIEDHGTGIDPDHLGKIFELKYTTKQSGLGFGLFWTKDYIEGLKGSIFVESTPGRGTKFTINLPIAQTEE